MRKPGLQTEKIQKELGKRQVTGKSPEHHRHQECQKIQRQYLYCALQEILPEDKFPPLIPQKQHESRQNKEKCNHLGACFEYHRHLLIILNFLAKVKKNHDAGRKKSENREYRCIYGSRLHLFGNRFTPAFRLVSVCQGMESVLDHLAIKLQRSRKSFQGDRRR